MSIIYDALRKVDHKTKESPSPRPSPVSYNQPSSKKSNRTVLVIISIVIMAGGVAGIYLQLKNAQKNTSLSPKNGPLASGYTHAEAPAEEPTPKPLRVAFPRFSFNRPELKTTQQAPNVKITDEGEFILSGIVFTSHKAIAIINGRRVSSGDTIEKATVSKIEEDSVELTVNNKKIVLAIF